MKKPSVFNERVGKKRSDKGMTQSEAARRLDIKLPTYQAYERSSKPNDINMIIKIADLFGVSVDYLLGRTEIETYDIQTRTICEYTGLSAAAIQRLHEITDNLTSLLSINQISHDELIQNLRESFDNRVPFFTTVSFLNKEMLDAVNKMEDAKTESEAESTSAEFKKLVADKSSYLEQLVNGEAALDFISTIVVSPSFKKIADSYSRMASPKDQDGNVIDDYENEVLGHQLKISLLLSKLFDESLPGKWLRIHNLETALSPQMRTQIKNAITDYREQLEASEQVEFDRWLFNMGIQNVTQKHKR